MGTLGTRITEYRKRNNMTQEQLAEAMGVSPQAVSKWENDISCPDISILLKLSELFQISVDELLKGREYTEVRVMAPEEKKNIDQMMIKIRVNSADGDQVKINLPVALIKVALAVGMEIPQFSGKEALAQIDIEQIIRLVEAGAIGKLVEVESSDGDTVDIIVE